ncbi:hypothetical protein E3E12_04455 [Formicincola oecophyllae]|uniref:Uncharacterized protein n=1 Tax=Formicincola oecophyllae TaxID=2558361 RepID=A0A4Y6U982_9PROT|nr:hypothetical protein [Formicincola oecophyllae]QDH13570.1 hypothetical protein E3E12_04455 [Formicincola oecophyllae]
MQRIGLDARGGDWAALHHVTDDGLSKDVCIAADPIGGLSLRADSDVLEIRAIDRSWHLHPGVRGNMKISIGSYEHVFPMQYGDKHMLAAAVPAESMKDLLEAMGKGQKAVLTFMGKNTQKTVSLKDTQKVLNAFRNCVESSGMANLGSAPDSNSPF